MRLWLLASALMVCVPSFSQKDPQYHTDYIPPQDTTAENRFPIVGGLEWDTATTRYIADRAICLPPPDIPGELVVTCPLGITFNVRLTWGTIPTCVAE
jgi:hypothetical protein